MSELPQILNQTCIHFNLFTHELELYKIKILMQEIISRSHKRSLGSWQWLCFVTVGARGTEKEGEVLHMGKREKNRKRKEHKNVAQTNICTVYIIQ